MVKPADFSEPMPSGGGTSIQSTCPARNAGSRDLAPGARIRPNLPPFAFFRAPQYPSQRARPASCRGTILVMRNGPVPAAGKVAPFAQSRPALSDEAGEAEQV